MNDAASCDKNTDTVTHFTADKTASSCIEALKQPVYHYCYVPLYTRRCCKRTMSSFVATVAGKTAPIANPSMPCPTSITNRLYAIVKSRLFGVRNDLPHAHRVMNGSVWLARRHSMPGYSAARHGPRFVEKQLLLSTRLSDRCSSIAPVDTTTRDGAAEVTRLRGRVRFGPTSTCVWDVLTLDWFSCQSDPQEATPEAYPMGAAWGQQEHEEQFFCKCKEILKLSARLFVL